MAVRMYALAKELKLDSKVLVDICTKAGIPGKGSALASLTDDEVVKLKQYLSGGSKPSKAAAPASAESKAAVAVKAPPTAGSAIRREDYIAPGGVSSKMPVLESKAKKQEKKSDAEGGSAVKPAARPTVFLAPLPPSEPAKTEAKPEEPAPQKPDLKLPADAIRAGKAGARPLAAHLRRQEQKHAETVAKQTAKPERRGAKPAAEALPSAAEGPLKGKARRGKGRDEAAVVEEVVEAKPGDKPLLGGREQRQLSRKRAGSRRRVATSADGEESGRPLRQRRRLRPRSHTNTAAPRKGRVVLSLPCTVRSFSEATGVPAAQIQGILLREGSMTTITAQLEPEMAEFVAEELGLEVELRHHVTLEDQMLAAIRDQQDDPDQLLTRPPVITFLGHVDHGKTSLLDRILHLNVVSGESGGITQHIRAYQVDKDGRKIAFVDTPGHEAFTEMRARGANVTDIAVLVVAADDGVMPQTEEAISHARAAEVPIVVALNKIDLPGIDVNRIFQQLASNDLLPSEWGGDTEVVRTSATTGEGVDDLLETLLTVAELHDYKANADRPAYGTCLEAQQEPGRGVIAKVLVQRGTLRVGDVLVCGEAYGRVKAMYDTLSLNQRVLEAGPSTPVNITGFDEAPAAGDHFYVLDEIATAREIAERRAAVNRTESLTGGRQHVTLENLFERLGGEGEVSTLNIILRADVRGSIEAILKELTKLEHEEVKIKVLQSSVGGITEADVTLADASDAIIIGFNVVPDEGARTLADRRGVQIRRYEIIYKVTEDLRAALEGMLKPEERVVELGRALVQQTFAISRVGTIAGCRVLSGNIERHSRVRVIRQSTVIGDYGMASLRRVKDDVKEVREGMECGIRLEGYNDLKEGDILEVYRIEEVGRKFD